jgi:AbrB family transcriptional regulator (stage V sporulation protein T)
MLATGMVRRVDELGRIVIPKEIRRTYRIHEGDPVEIFTEDDGLIILRKYAPGTGAKESAARLTATFAAQTGLGAVLCDRDAVLAAAGPGKRDVCGPLCEPLAALIAARTDGPLPAPVRLCEGDLNLYTAQAICPVLCNGDLYGGALLFSTKEGAAFTPAREGLLCGMLAALFADELV